MRLTAQQTEQILAVVHCHFGAASRAAVLRFRLDDTACGGDVDLLVDSPQAPTLLLRAGATRELEGAWQLLVDTVAVKQGEPGSVLVQIARPKAAARQESGVV